MSVAEPLEGSARMPGKAGFLDDVAGFDHRFFGISPREAAAMDPQQRLLLEVAWEALEDAGVVPAQVTRGRCGVYIGSMWTDYARLFDLTDHGPHSATGLETSLLSGRLSHLLGLTGPSLTVSTACSSSLVAVHLACQSLLSGETSIALAGGVNLLLTPDSTAIMKAFGGLSPRERCRTFDSSADGYVRGEGCGVLVLKPLSTALEDGDPVHGVILGSAVNHNGHVGGVTASSVRAQKVLIRAACASAGISPTAVDYVEAHGTGTAQGDPVELRALKSALCEGRPQDHPLWVGSVKTNIGHLEAAAGVAGLVKVLLALRHRLLPAHLHLKKPHPEVDPALLRIPVTTVSWPSTAERALAGVSSFGFSGTNAHVVVQQAPPSPALGPAEAQQGGLALMSARAPEALDQAADELAAHLRRHADTNLDHLCATLALHRTHHPHRLALTADTTEQLAQNLQALAEGAPVPRAARGHRAGESPSTSVLVFSGQGTQWAGMARSLRTFPAFHEALEQCAKALAPHCALPVLAALYGEAPKLDLSRTDVAQPVVFALQVALARLLGELGPDPDRRRRAQPGRGGRRTPGGAAVTRRRGHACGASRPADAPDRR